MLGRSGERKKAATNAISAEGSSAAEEAASTQKADRHYWPKADTLIIPQAVTHRGKRIIKPIIYFLKTSLSKRKYPPKQFGLESF